MNSNESFLWSDGFYRTTPEPETDENIIRMRDLAARYKRERDEAVQWLRLWTKGVTPMTDSFELFARIEQADKEVRNVL